MVTTKTSNGVPGWNDMLEQIEAGKVKTVVVKDISRLGRDYLKVRFYTEVMFVGKVIRFIAINNGINSNNQQDSDFTPFLNIINEWYAKDTSKKIRAVMKSKGEAGNTFTPTRPTVTENTWTILKGGLWTKKRNRLTWKTSWSNGKQNLPNKNSTPKMWNSLFTSANSIRI